MGTQLRNSAWKCLVTARTKVLVLTPNTFVRRSQGSVHGREHGELGLIDVLL